MNMHDVLMGILIAWFLFGSFLTWDFFRIDMRVDNKIVKEARNGYGEIE